MNVSIKNLTSDEIRNMSYNELIGLVQETNRPPGGIGTLNVAAQHARITDNTRLLEIGTSTGITAVELAMLTQCNIDAIDINEMSLEKARQRAVEYGVEDNINFQKLDAINLPFADGTFDSVFYGNVISIISDKKKGFIESLRVLKAGGYVIFVPMYYIKKPSDNLLKSVSDAIKVDVKYLTKDYWLDFLGTSETELFYKKDYMFDDIAKEKVQSFADKILARDHLKDLNKEAKLALNNCYTEQMLLFRENLAHMGYSILIYRKNIHPTDEDLFTASEV